MNSNPIDMPNADPIGQLPAEVREAHARIREGYAVCQYHGCGRTCRRYPERWAHLDDYGVTFSRVTEQAMIGHAPVGMPREAV